MRAYVIGLAVVGVVVGGAWLVLALFHGHLSGSEDAYARSLACVRSDHALARVPPMTVPFHGPGLQALGIRWQGVRAVALFSDSLSPGSVDKVDARIVSGLHRQGVSTAEIGRGANLTRRRAARCSPRNDPRAEPRSSP